MGALPDRVPNAERARVSPAKTSGYLLDESRRSKPGFKAGFFRGVLGFQNAELLADRLRNHVAQNGPVSMVRNAVHTHDKYEVRGPFMGQNGRKVLLTSVWVIDDDGDGSPRFVTATPAQKRARIARR